MRSAKPLNSLRSSAWPCACPTPLPSQMPSSVKIETMQSWLCSSSQMSQYSALSRLIASMSSSAVMRFVISSSMMATPAGSLAVHYI